MSGRAVRETDGVRDAAPTAAESEFFGQLRAAVPEVQDWYHADDDGTPWVTASYDDVVGGSMTATWRIDFDGEELVGGRSPANLNWDDGVRARATGMSVEPPEGITVTVSSPRQAARLAADWFAEVTEGRATS